MSALIPNEQEGKELGGDLSKRELMKLEKALRRLDQTNQEIKHPKRRGHSSIAANQPTRRKEVKLDPSPSPQAHDQLYSSPINSSEPLSTTPPHAPNAPRALPTHLNSRYRLPEGDSNIFNYLLSYSYAEDEKRLERECQDWSGLQQLPQEPLALVSCAASSALCEKLSSRIREVKDKLREPLGKTHREISQRFLKKNPLYSYSLHQHYHHTTYTIHSLHNNTDFLRYQKNVLRSKEDLFELIQ